MIFLPETVLSESAKTSRWRHHWIIDILIAGLLFIISQIIILIISSFPIVSIYFINSLFTHKLSAHTIIDSDYIHSLNISLELINTYVMILVCLFYCIFLEHRSIYSLGFITKKPALDYLKGYFIGFILFILAWFLNLLTGAIKYELNHFSPLIVLFFIGFIVQGLSEEVLCRSFLLQTLSTRYRPIVAVFLNSIFFSILHLSNHGISLLAVINLFLFGLFASLYFWKSGSIWGIAAVHSAWNFTQGNILGVQVSGINAGPSIILSTGVQSKEIMNGGSFGLEGGLGVTIVLIISLIILILLPIRKDNQLETK